MEATLFSTIASRYFSSTPPSLSASKCLSRGSTNSHCSWHASKLPGSLSRRNPFTVMLTNLVNAFRLRYSVFNLVLVNVQREVWSLVKSKSVSVRRQMRSVVRAEMFGQLTSGLEAAWAKLKGEGFVHPLTSITN